MTGGFYDKRRSKLKFMNIIRQNAMSISTKESELQSVRSELQDILYVFRYFLPLKLFLYICSFFTIILKLKKIFCLLLLFISYYETIQDAKDTIYMKLLKTCQLSQINCQRVGLDLSHIQIDKSMKLLMSSRKMMLSWLMGDQNWNSLSKTLLMLRNTYRTSLKLLRRRFKGFLLPAC